MRVCLVVCSLVLSFSCIWVTRSLQRFIFYQSLVDGAQTDSMTKLLNKPIWNLQNQFMRARIINMLFAGPASRQITYMYSHVLWRSFARILIFSYSVWKIRIWNTCYVQSRSRNCTKPFSLSQKRCFHLFENKGQFFPTGIKLSANTFIKQFSFVSYKNDVIYFHSVYARGDHWAN